MAAGDIAQASGFAVVPEVGEEGLVRWGAREINRTRDMLAQIKNLIPVGKIGYRRAAGISSGTATPTGGSPGDIYLKIL